MQHHSSSVFKLMARLIVHDLYVYAAILCIFGPVYTSWPVLGVSESISAKMCSNVTVISNTPHNKAERLTQLLPVNFACQGHTFVCLLH